MLLRPLLFRTIQHPESVFGTVKVKIIKLRDQHLGKRGFAGLSRAGDENDFAGKIVPDRLCKIPVHADYSTLHSEKVKAVSECGLKRSEVGVGMYAQRHRVLLFSIVSRPGTTGHGLSAGGQGFH